MPLVVMLLFLGVIVSILLTGHYERVIKHVSQNQLEVTSSNLHSSLNLFLKQPFDASESIGYTIKINNLYRMSDTSQIQKYLHSSIQAIYSKIDHIDVIGFGGKLGEFIGYRRNDDSSYSLMLKDLRTRQSLIIYEGEGVDSEVAQMIAGYDPRKRPWYALFDSSSSWKPSWSSIYVNSDEKEATTLSALHPLIIDNSLLGVLVADVKLDSFNTFLLNSRRLTQSHFFIFDDENRLVAHSEPTSTSVDGLRLHISDSPTELNQAISKALLEKHDIIFNFQQVFSVKANHQRYFVKLTPYYDEKGLNWFIVTAVSESDLLGTLWYSQIGSLVNALLIMTIPILIAIYVFQRITSPITETAAAARRFSDGDWNTRITANTHIAETRQLVETFNDMTLNLNESFQKLRRQMNYDNLTHLHSRFGFIEESDKTDNSEATLYTIGINDFKQINLTHGHNVSDQVLNRIANRLRRLLSPTDVIGRVSEDEFALLRFGDSTEYDFQLMASRIQQGFDTAISVDRLKIRVDLSLGIVRACPNLEMDQWLRKGSMALSLAQKEQLPLCFYNEQMSTEHQRKSEMLEYIRRGLANQEFLPYYQPIVDLHSNQITGAEALARWHSSHLGMVSPIEFVPIAEESGLINELGRQILFSACRDGMKGIQQGRWGDSFHMHVNVSVAQLKETMFADMVLDTLEQTRFPAQQLTLEITESQILETHPEITENLKRLYRKGINIAIDDFGTGYSSLAYLHKLPFNTLKIDRTFVSDLNRDNAEISIVSAIINIIDGFEVTVVAEGVETIEQQSILKELNCSQAQGFLYGKPVPFDEWQQLENQQQKSHLI
ncbi:bifunctional diguanylate cyclase/phosphodiesterase [Vibrio superstes]|nr:EAL domain-containing protein [Vibrio superstes]